MKIKRLTQALLLSMLTTSSAYSQYCNPTITAPPVATWGIEAVQFSNLLNPSSIGGFSNFTTDTATVTLGSTNTFVISFSGSPQLGKVVWIDWNKDDSFDSTERYVFADFTNSLDIVTPASATIGTTRMRVALTEYGEATPDACTTALYEVEDYTVKISDGSSAGITELDKAPSPFSLYPNPAQNAVNIEWLEEEAKSALHIINSQGRSVVTISKETIGSSIDVSDLAAGIYFIQVESIYPIAPVRLTIK